jgi:hypothetical protein
LAYKELKGKAKLKNDLANAKIRVINAQDELNYTVNGKPLTPGTPAYIAADKKFKDAIAARDAAQLALDNYKEPEKPKSAKQIEAERQQAIIDGKVPPAGSIVDGEPNTNQTKQVDDFAGLIKTAPTLLRGMKDDERLQLAAQLKNAGYEVPQIKAYNDTLLAGYTSLISGAKAKNKQFPNDIKTVDDFLTEQTNIAAQIKAAGGDTKLEDPFGTQQIYNKSTAEGVIDNLFQTILKRDASSSEINSLFKELQAEQKKLSSMSKGTYKMVNGRKVLVKEEGLDPRVFLENKIKELPAYKESLAAKSEQNKLSLASTALANGYDLERDFGTQLPNWLDAINKGESISKFQSTIRNSARLALPEAVRNSIDPNEDLTTSFATYISNFAKTFGMPANQVSLSKIIPLATNEKGFVPIYDFEKKKRQLAEWDLTPDARTETANVVSTVLKDFGFKG